MWAFRIEIKMKNLKILAALALSLIPVFANSLENKLDPKDPLIERFARLGVEVTEIHETPIEGLKELVTNRGVIYTSLDGQFLVRGAIIDLDNRTNLTELKTKSLRNNQLQTVEDSMIVYKAPDEKHKITIFTDITCGYCRKLHNELDDLLSAGVTVRYLAFPRNGLQSSGYTALINVWCANDSQTALTRAKAGENIVSAMNCGAPLVEHYNLGKSFGFNATPAIILEDGTVIPGYQSAPELINALKAINAS